MPETWKRHLGKRRLSGLEEISFNEIAKKINCSTIVTLGSEESKHAERRANETKKRIKNCQKIIINGANHNIGNKLYLNALKDLIRIYG